MEISIIVGIIIYLLIGSIIFGFLEGSREDIFTTTSLIVVFIYPFLIFIFPLLFGEYLGKKYKNWIKK